MESFAFDFADWRTNMAPAEMRLRLPISHGGIWNAVAFWFELELDEETSLSTSPYADKACSTPRCLSIAQCQRLRILCIWHMAITA